MKAARRESLVDLDDRVLPTLGRILRDVGGAWTRIAGPEGVVGRRVAPLVRREPVAAVAVVCVVVAAVLLAVTGGDSQSVVRPGGAPSALLSDPHRLGPAPGTTFASYSAAAAQRRSALAGLAASDRRYAVVDLSRYVTAQTVDELLGHTPGVDVVRAFARVPPPTPADIHVLITSPSADIATGLAAAHDAAEQIVTTYQREVELARVSPTQQLAAAIAAGAARAAQAQVDAVGLGRTCGCVFALIVSGPVGQLTQLAALPPVRVLDPATGPAPLSTLMVVPVEPQITGIVPPLAFAGD
jgi:hypothetical protein